MNRMLSFYPATSFNQPLNKWNVSKEVTNMSFMFYNAMFLINF